MGHYAWSRGVIRFNKEGVSAHWTEHPRQSRRSNYEAIGWIIKGTVGTYVKGLTSNRGVSPDLERRQGAPSDIYRNRFFANNAHGTFGGRRPLPEL